jgi:hypothetical protein
LGKEILGETRRGREKHPDRAGNAGVGCLAGTIILQGRR